MTRKLIDHLPKIIEQDQEVESQNLSTVLNQQYWGFSPCNLALTYEDEPAYITTKPLAKENFEKFRQLIMGQ